MKAGMKSRNSQPKPPDCQPAPPKPPQPPTLADVMASLVAISSKLDQLLKGNINMALDITALQTAVANETTIDSSVETLITQVVAQETSMAAQIQTLITSSGNTVDPADLQAIVYTMSANATALGQSRAALQAAITANTPAAPPATS